MPYYLAAGSDGALWFTNYDDCTVGNITSSGQVKLYSLSEYNHPTGITAGPENSLWTLETDGMQAKAFISRIATDGTVTDFPIPVTSPCTCGWGNDITTGPDGALWFTMLDQNAGMSYIGRMDTLGVVTKYNIPNFQSVAHSITTGPDGALWFTETDFNGGNIGRLATNGTITEYPLPTGVRSYSGITTGPDGALWFTESNGNIGRITISGTITNFAIPYTGANPNGITTGPDGALWFTDTGTNSVGRVMTDGAITEYSVPSSNSDPNGITTGPDGALWFTEMTTNKIARVNLVSAPTAPTNLTLTTPNPTNQNPSLSWTAPTPASATSYNIYRDGTQIATGITSTIYTDTTAPQGNDTYTVTAINSAGESPASNSVSVLFDTTLPNITYTVSPAPSSSGWNSASATVTFSCSDPTAGVTITSCSSPVTVAVDGANQQVTGTAVDSAGNTASVTATVNLDATAPTITGTVSQANGQPVNAAGWFNSPVTVSYSCSDATSGIATCSTPQTESTDGSYDLTGYASDNAGNSASVNTNVNLDQTPPTVANVSLGSSPLAMGATTNLTAAVNDNLSGVSKVEYFVGSDPGQGNGTSMTYDSSTGTARAPFGPFSTPGSYTAYVRSQDVAGNWSSPQNFTFTVYPAATNLSLIPTAESGTVGGVASFTATATDINNQPVASLTIRYSVSGSVTSSGSCVTDGTGTCTISYNGPQLPGADLIMAYADNNTNSTQDQGEPTANASMSWDLPASSTTSGWVHGHGKFIAANGDKITVGFHALNQNGTVSGACNIVDQTTGVVLNCTDATVLVKNTTTGQATIFGDITINGQATTYRMDVADNSATSNPDTFNFVTQSGYSVGGTMDKGSVTVN